VWTGHLKAVSLICECFGFRGFAEWSKKMKSLTAQQIIKEYTEYAEIQGQSMLDGNYKMNNKMVKKINV
jgi:hypothetical protein